jgi:hypothetical protein
VQVSGRALETGAALVGEGRELLQERAAGAGPQLRTLDESQRDSQQAASAGAQSHRSAAGLVRRKQDMGVDMTGMGVANASRDAKEE